MAIGSRVAKAWENAAGPAIPDNPVDSRLALWNTDMEQAWQAANRALNVNAPPGKPYGISRETFAQLLVWSRRQP